MSFWRVFGILTLTLLILFALIAVAVTRQSTQAPDQSKSALNTATINLERTGCYGNCPSYLLTLRSDGTVEYEGRNYVETKGRQHGTIENELIKSLLSEFARTNFMSTPDSYSSEKCSCGFCTDLPSAITQVTINGVTHRVDHYYGCRCAPKSLFALEKAIDKAANVEQWTGDVSKSGPLGTTCTD